MSDDTEQPEPSPPANGERLHIYFLPNLMTAGNLLCGFLALTFIVQVVPDPTGSEGPVFSATDIEKIKNALWLILGAFVFDGLDGRIARLVGKESPFGLQFDSLADIISFGAAPAFLMQRVILHDFNVEIERLGLVVASVYLLCGALRLARYNCLSAMPNSGNGREFLGFPIPASAAMVASLTMFLVWLEEKNLPTSSWRWVLLALLVFLSVMMVSEVKYPSFKKLDFRSRRPFTKFVTAVVVVACFVFLWKYLVPIVLPLIFTSYLVYGFVRPRLSRKLRREIEEDFDDE
ncbi:MAG: CDP-diacylglycerol--serine O-phosphatidyltransferase [Verrucomicrobiota bacterium]|nr:CDP-diacylglycerol--serine O-phosphatidyltransferase [Verrucomicrobiota bacterium]MDP6914774.1 CDP-diacylglycerol--serine O-phosphatidyltransferase [Verrucomicrobiota bacterium]